MVKPERPKDSKDGCSPSFSPRQADFSPEWARYLPSLNFFLQQLKQENDLFIIPDEVWENAKRKMKESYQGSSKFYIWQHLIQDFEATSTKRKYLSDFEIFIRESKLEDFLMTDGETILVSTIHKAKGKEFDHVFLLLEDFDVRDDAQKRHLYVAMTRAKQKLTIHLNSNFLEPFHAEELERVENNQVYSIPNELVLHLSNRDLNLGYFTYVQKRVHALTSGDALTISEEGCKNPKGNPVLKFSRTFLERLAKIKKSGYTLKEAKVNFIVFWTNEDREREVKVVLPELVFEKTVDLYNQRVSIPAVGGIE